MFSEIALLVAACTVGADAPGRLEFDVPRLDAIAIDGDGADWRDAGFLADVFPDQNMRLIPPSDFQPTLRLAWNDEGLLVLLTVRDDQLTEIDNPEAMWDGDSFELFVGREVGDRDFYQIVLGPGVTENQPELRHRFLDFRRNKAAELVLESARAQSGDGYTIELLLPWSNLGMTAEESQELGFQIYFNDVDDGPGRFQAIWYPATRTHENPDRMHPIRLSSRNASPAQHIRARGAYDGLGRTVVDLRASPDLVGEAYTIRSGKQVLASGALDSDAGWASARVLFPVPEPGQHFDTLMVRAGEDTTALFLPDAEYERQKTILGLEMRPARAVFLGTAFPLIDFENPLQAEALIGPYTITTRFFARDYTEVERAEAAGRYGAVVEARSTKGITVRRYLTLYRAPEGYNDIRIWFVRPEPQLPLPLELGLSDEALAVHGESLGKFYQETVAKQFRWDWRVAALVSGIAETSGDAKTRTAQDDAYAMDRQWWVGLKRKLNGNDQRFNRGLAAPAIVKGAPAPVLREGTEAEAGMRAGSVDALDTLFTEWAEKSGEPFSVCLARNGVVFLHRAYGMNYEQPMTVDTQRWIASISKFFSGTLIAQFVDQGLVDLDAPVADYLPAFEGIDVPHDLTIRHLYTHTNGLNLGIELPLRYADHWGDEDHDLEARIAAFYPVQHVNVYHGYNGVGYALGGKVMEQVSGDALPTLFQKNMIEPLGLEHTDATDGSARTFSVAHDLAIWGQMLLNRGAYGNRRFMSEDTFEAIMPKPIAHLMENGNADLEWGIGCVWMRRPGLSAHAFGHGAASASDFVVDPELGLVIAMTRNQAGPLWLEYHDKYFELLTGAVEK